MNEMQDNHQENNYFKTIISTWRVLAERKDIYQIEQVESGALTGMSGDSSNHQQSNKKLEEESSLVIERPKGPIATAASGGVLVSADGPQEKDADIANPEEKQEKSEFIKRNKEEDNDGAGDYKEANDDKSYLENENENGRSKTSNAKYDKEKGDLVDSVYLRPPPSHKARPNSQTNDEEDCGIKCLYYTLQCCDCVLM